MGSRARLLKTALGGSETDATHTRQRRYELSDFLTPVTRRRNGVSSLESEQSRLTTEIERLSQNLSAHRAFSPEVTAQKIDSLRSENINLEKSLSEYRSRQSSLKNEISKLSATKTPAILVWKYFTSEQSALRLKISTHKEELSIIDRRVSETLGNHEKNKKAISSLTDNIEKFRKTDPEALQSQINNLIKKKRNLLNEILVAKEELREIENKVSPLLSERQDLIKQLKSIEDDIRQAESYNAALSKTSDKKRKWEIHQQCGERFGEDQPNKIIKARSGRRDGINRGLHKIESRISEELAKFDMTVNALVIDGNNMCYDSENTFIGLTALRKVTSAIKDKYAVTVVFDPSITKQLRATRDDIARNLGKGISTYVAPPGDSADSYILNLADNKQDTYVISNDIYTDYPDHECVKSKRIFGFFIANGRAIVRSLDINEAY